MAEGLGGRARSLLGTGQTQASIDRLEVRIETELVKAEARLLERLDAVAASMPVPEPVDFQPVIARIDALEKALPPPPVVPPPPPPADLGPVETRLGGVEQALAGVRESVEAALSSDPGGKVGRLRSLASRVGDIDDRMLALTKELGTLRVSVDAAIAKPLPAPPVIPPFPEIPPSPSPEDIAVAVVQRLPAPPVIPPFPEIPAMPVPPNAEEIAGAVAERLVASEGRGGSTEAISALLKESLDRFAAEIKADLAAERKARTLLEADIAVISDRIADLARLPSGRSAAQDEASARLASTPSMPPPLDVPVATDEPIATEPAPVVTAPPVRKPAATKRAPAVKKALPVKNALPVKKAPPVKKDPAAPVAKKQAPGKATPRTRRRSQVQPPGQ